MIFKEIISEKAKLLNPVFDQLFELTIKNQIHSGDLLLVNENGFYYPEALNGNNLDMNSLPYTIGPDKETLSEYVHYKFIDYYRKTFEYRMSFEEYLLEIEWKPEKREKIEELIFQEELSIQLEMLVYLKIWESDSFIKRFYQLARLSNGEEYDWHFKIAESNREKDSTGTRHEILREKVRDKFKKTLPCLFSSFKKSYKTQVRNSIAHSKYSFLNRYIHLNNFIEGDKSSQLRSLKFGDWIDIFHESMILYNGYVRFFNKVNSYYAAIAKKNGNLIEVKLNMKEPKERVELMYMEYRPEWNDFKLKLD